MQKVLPFLVFVTVLGLARTLGALTPEDFPNLQPLGALFFCGMALFGWRGTILPGIAWLITYPITSLAQGHGMSSQILIPLLGFTSMVVLASLFKNSSPLRIFLGSLASAIIFYLITNTLSWALDPLYAPKSLATLSQALWTGLPSYPPTWLFFRNALIAQSIFSAIFLLATTTIPLTFSKSRLQTSS